MGIILGFKDPNNGVLVPKYYDIHGIWALKPYYLGPWTLRVFYFGNRNLALAYVLKLLFTT